MGAFLERPECTKETGSSARTDLGLEVALSAMQGWRVDMEDAHTVKLGMDDAKDYSWFAVFDGHGGSLVSVTAANNVLNKITNTPHWKSDNRSLDSISKALKKGFLEMDDDLRKLPEVVRGDDHSGSTAIAALLTPTHIICANVGDSRCMLVRRNPGHPSGVEAIDMSYDHKPYLETEMKRITNAGGTVTMRRVNGDLAVSRALGDFVYKHRRDLPAEDQQVSAEPEILARERTPNDVFLVLACDGIWDVMNNQEVAEFINGRPHANPADLERTCEALLDECLSRGSRDNMSVVIATFVNNFPAGTSRAGTGRPPIQYNFLGEPIHEVLAQQAAEKAAAEKAAADKAAAEKAAEDAARGGSSSSMSMAAEPK